MIKIALVHDHLAQDGGAEKVLETLMEIFPQASVFTLIYDKKNTSSSFFGIDIKTSFLQNMPLGIKRYQWWVGLMPLAIESINLTDYDLVITSTSSFAKGVITKPDTKHICYCHTPTRYLWTDMHSYVEELKVNPIIKAILPLTLKKLRLWDRLAAERPDIFLANSETVRKRIKKYYNRTSEVIYPPVNVDDFYISNNKKRFYLAGGRMVSYKKFDLIVRAFVRLGVPLKIFGVGPEMKYLKKLATNKASQKNNIEFLGKVTDEQKKWLYANCLAYINPQEEDFGITAVEAMASGRPVIAYRAGGASETVMEGITGEFFDEQIWEDIADKVIRFNENKYNFKRIKEHSEIFSKKNFMEKIIKLAQM